MEWNNYSIRQLEEDLGFHSDFPEFADGGLKRYKSGDFLGAAKRYLTAYKYLRANMDFFENIHSECPLYFRHNVFYIYRNCVLMRIAQITMFLNNDEKLSYYIPFAAASECFEFDEEKFREEVSYCSSLPLNDYFYEFYLDALAEVTKMRENETDLKNYMFKINQNFAAGRLAVIKREIKYKISGIR